MAKINNPGYSHTEDIMDALVAVVKPLILKLATHPAVKNLVIELFEKYVKTTDNSIDDMVLVTVKELLFKPQE